MAITSTAVMGSNTVGDLLVRVGVDMSSLGASFAKVDRMFDSFGNRMYFLGSRVTVGLSAPVALAVKSIAQIGIAFDQAMTESLAIMGKTAPKLRAAMEDVAIQVSNTTKFSAKEAAEGYYHLASAGYSAEEAMKALPVVAQFAQAGMMGLAQSTEFLAGAQAELGMKTGDTAQDIINMTRVSDVLTEANNLALGTIKDFADALTNKAGAMLRIFNKDVEEGTAAIMAYATQNIKGKLAGNQLYMVIRDLARYSTQHTEAWKKYNIQVFDASGNMRHLADIIEDFEQALSGANDAQKTFIMRELGLSDRSRAATQYLLGYSSAIREWDQSLRAAGGTTGEVADKQMQSFQNQLLQAVHRVQNLAIALWKDLEPVLRARLLPAIDDGIKKLKELTDWFSSLSDDTKYAALRWTAYAAAMGPVIMVLGSLTLAARALITPLTVVMSLLGKGVLFAGMKTVQSGMTAVLTSVGVQGTQLANALKTGNDLLGKQVTAMQKSSAAAGFLNTVWSGLVNTLKLLTTPIGVVTTGIGLLVGAIWKFSDNWQEFADVVLLPLRPIQWIGKALLDLFKWIDIDLIAVAKSAWKGFTGLADVVGVVGRVIVNDVAAFSRDISTAEGAWKKFQDTFGWGTPAGGFGLGKWDLIGGLTTDIKDFAAQVAQLFKDEFPGMVTRLEGMFDRVRAGLRSILNPSTESGRVVQETMWQNSNPVFSTIYRGVNAWRDPQFVKSMADRAYNIPQLQSGAFNQAFKASPFRGTSATGPLSQQQLDLFATTGIMPRSGVPRPNENELGWVSGVSGWNTTGWAPPVEEDDDEKRSREAFVRAVDSLTETLRGTGGEDLKQFVAAWNRLWTVTDTGVQGPTDEQIWNAWDVYKDLRKTVSADKLPPALEKQFAGQIAQGEIAQNIAALQEGAAEMQRVQDEVSEGIRKWAQEDYPAFIKAALRGMAEISAGAKAEAADTTAELSLFTQSYVDQELVGLRKGRHAKGLELDKNFAQAVEHFKKLGGAATEEDAKTLIELSKNQQTILDNYDKMGQLRVAKSLGFTTTQIRHLAQMEEAERLSLIRRKANWQEFMADLDAGLSAINHLASGLTSLGFGNVASVLNDITAGTKSFATGLEAMATAGGDPLAFLGGLTQAFSGLMQVFGKLIKMIGPKSGWEQIMGRVGHDWGVTISQDLAKTIEDDAKKLFHGDWAAAEIFNLSGILGEAGGLNAGNFDVMIGKFRDIFVMLGTGKFTAQEATTALSKSFQTFADYVVNTGQIASAKFVEILDLIKREGLEIPEMIAFLSSQMATFGTQWAAVIAPVASKYEGLAAKILEAKDAVAGMTEEDEGYADAVEKLNKLLADQTAGAAASADELERLGRIAVAAFNNAIERGVPFLAAFRSMEPALNSLVAVFADLGMSATNPALAALLDMQKLVNDNKALVDAVDAFNGAIVTLSTMGGLTGDVFADLQVQGTAMFEQLTAAGFTQTQALQMMVPYFESILKANKEFGFEIDANTAALIAQAKEAGLLKGETLEMTDILMLGFAGIIEALGGEVPAAFRNALDRMKTDLEETSTDLRTVITDTLADIEIPTIRIPYTFDDLGGRPPELDVPKLGTGGIATRPTLAVVGDVPEAIIPLDQLGAAGGSRQTIYVQIGSKTVAQAVAEGLPSVLRVVGVR